MTIKKICNLASALTFLLPVALTAQTQRQHDAHEHGVSELKIALDGKLLQITLEAPGADIVGFEHAAENDAQKAQVKSALSTLKDPLKIFVFPKAAGCSVSASEAAFKTEHEEEEHHDKKHHEGEDDDEGHAEFHVSYSLSCTSPVYLSTIGLKFFDLFSDAKELEVEAASNHGQFAAEIMRGEKSIDLSSIIAPVIN